MGIFSNDDNSQASRVRTAVKERKPAVGICLQVACDRCHVALAQVEVITDAGPVFLCQHHHLEHRTSIVAAGHQIRRRLGSREPRQAVRAPVIARANGRTAGIVLAETSLADGLAMRGG